MGSVVMVSEQIGGDHKGAWAQLVKNLPTVQETQVPSLGWEDPLEKEMAPTLVFLLGKSYRQWSLVGYSPWHRESQT